MVFLGGRTGISCYYSQNSQLIFASPWLLSYWNPVCSAERNCYFSTKLLWRSGNRQPRSYPFVLSSDAVCLAGWLYECGGGSATLRTRSRYFTDGAFATSDRLQHFLFCDCFISFIGLGLLVEEIFTFLLSFLNFKSIWDPIWFLLSVNFCLLIPHPSFWSRSYKGGCFRGPNFVFLFQIDAVDPTPPAQAAFPTPSLPKPYFQSCSNRFREQFDLRSHGYFESLAQFYSRLGLIGSVRVQGCWGDPLSFSWSVSSNYTVFHS